jgi:tripartite-type tricarboxylate transporter receptor subunit TctC
MISSLLPGRHAFSLDAVSRWLLVAIAFLTLGLTDARAQSWPARPVTIVVPYPAGGPTDYYARLLAEELQKIFASPFVVENRAGATGVIGYDRVAKAAPDGYTLGLGLGALTIMPSLRKDLPFDVLRDFTPISVMLYSQNVLIVNPSLPVQSVKELIDLAKTQPGKLSYASSGVGATPHLSLELLKTMAEVNINHVPYKGDAPAVTDVMGGHVHMYCSTIGGAIQQIRQGRVRAIAVTGKQRASALPDVPTMAEAGLPGYEITSWYGLIAPAGTPDDIIGRLHGAMVKIISNPDIRQKILASGSEPATNTPAELQTMMRADIEKYARIIKAAGVEPQ